MIAAATQFGEGGIVFRNVLTRNSCEFPDPSRQQMNCSNRGSTTHLSCYTLVGYLNVRLGRHAEEQAALTAPFQAEKADASAA
jgi:hypothetical protein